MKNKSQKGIQILLFMCIFLFSGTMTGLAQALGDVNNSGEIDIIDALMIAQYYVGLNPSGFIQSAADVNCSGGIDIVDALLVAQFYVGLVSELTCPDDTPTPGGTTPTPAITPDPGTSGPTSPPGELYTGNSTWFTNLGMPYGGCGVTQSALDTQHFVALNVQDTPGDYTTFLQRPISSANAGKIGLFNNGLNCGRWVRVTIGDYCNGTNDGAQNQEFCRGGSGWTGDKYNGAVLDMIIADSCQDGNAWCRDDPYHVDLARDSLNQFVKDGQPVGDMDPDHYNNRQVHWQFIEAPNYSGDIRIGFIESAQIWWSAIAITHLRNGIHGVDYWDGSAWVKAEMNADMGQSYIIKPIVEGGSEYRIRVYDVNDQLLNNGRVYSFPFPESCGTQCSTPFNEVSYTTE
ncbi:MAG: dockerin type I repeat-containing protein [Spirochaetales bacterium]|nr:dockerin type I repeat-containing protein [Spirochaetales bacterium]